MAALELLVRNVIPVNSFVKADTAKDVVTPPPDEVGVCFGKQSTFSHSAQHPTSEQENGIRVNQIGSYGDEEVNYKGDEVHREWERVEFPHPDQGAAAAPVESEMTEGGLGRGEGSAGAKDHFKTEAIKSVTFFLGEREVATETRERQGNLTVIQPKIEHIKEYFVFNFPIASEVETRGEAAPESTPPHPSSETEMDSSNDQDEKPRIENKPSSQSDEWVQFWNQPGLVGTGTGIYYASGDGVRVANY